MPAGAAVDFRARGGVAWRVVVRQGGPWCGGGGERNWYAQPLTWERVNTGHVKHRMNKITNKTKKQRKK